MFLSLKAAKLKYAGIPSFFDHARSLDDQKHSAETTLIGFSIKFTRKGLFLNWSLEVKLVMN